MNDPLRRLWASIMPVVGMIIFVALIVIGIFVFSYLLIIGAIIGLILFIIAFIRSKISRVKKSPDTASGRTIEHNEINKNKH